MTRPRLRIGSVSRSILILSTLAVISVGGPTRCAWSQAALQGSDNVSLNDGVPREVRDVKMDQNLGGRIPLDLPLVDSKGRQVETGYFIDGQKPTIVTLNYSDCPMLCSVQLSQLALSLGKLDLGVGDDFQILTVSIDPNETTEAAAKTKAKYVSLISDVHANAEEGWEFCTANQATITELADVLGFRYTYDEKSGEYYHPAMLAFISPEGVITRYSLEVGFEPNDMRKALVEAGEGTVGSPVDQLVLWCFSYDPSSNSYVPQAWKIMRAGGAATVLLILACMAPYWFGRKRVPPPEQPESVQSESHPSSAD